MVEEIIQDIRHISNRGYVHLKASYINNLEQTEESLDMICERLKEFKPHIWIDEIKFDIFGDLYIDLYW